MFLPLIGPRLHGWLDDLVAATYLLGVVLLGLQGAARVVAITGAAVHFMLTRFTNYPQGTFKLIPFRTHAFIELGEGIGILVSSIALTAAPPGARGLLALMGLSQFVAFAFSDYATPTRC